MRIGANLITNDTTISILEVAPMVEAAGLDSIFQGEHSHIPVETVFPAFDGDGARLLQALPGPLRHPGRGGCRDDERCASGPAIVLVAEHQPLRLAKAVASLDELSGGRVDFGVGYGWNAAEMANNGVDPSRRREVFREYLRVISELWAEDVVDHDGDLRVVHAVVVPAQAAPDRLGGDRVRRS